MRFLFVDKITDLRGDAIRGLRVYPADEPLVHRTPGHLAAVAPGAVSEAIGQLASWLCLERNRFAARPIFLFADAIRVRGAVRPGDEVELRAEIRAMDVDNFRFDGEARVGGRLVQEIEACSGHFMPLAELEDPALTCARFAALIGGGLVLDGPGGAPYPFAALAGETLALVAGRSVRARKEFSADEPFYGDHFPRFPVTPIVMLNEMIGATTTRLLGGEKSIQIRAIHGIKIRSFVRPGETVETVVTVTGERRDGGRSFLETTAQVLKDQKVILRGNYLYEIME